MAPMSKKELCCWMVGDATLFIITVVVMIFNIQSGQPVTLGSYVAIIACSFGFISIPVYITKRYCDSNGNNTTDAENTDQQQTIVRLTGDGFAVSVVRRSFGERIIEALKAMIIGNGKGMQV